MSLPRPSGMKTPTPSKGGKSTGLQQPRSGLMPPGSIARAQSAIAKSARAAGLPANVAEIYAAETVHNLSGPDEEMDVSQASPSDDFIIGDRVFVSGAKPGYIAFLGEAQFAPGEWAGVVLDDTIGKNDGAVGGVRYFQCEPKRGVFCRISKLSRTPDTDTPAVVQAAGPKGDVVSVAKSNGESTTADSQSAPVRRPTTPSRLQRPTTPSLLHRPTTPVHNRPTTPSHNRPTTPSHNRPTTPSLLRTGVMSKSLTTSSTSINKGPVATKTKMSEGSSASGVKFNLKIGDRVFVSGSKPGTLRYCGPTDFAKGEWAGVELDDAMGKNDGAVAGKRYFDCSARYGLFAPIHKVTRLTENTTPAPQVRSLSMTGLRLSRERSGSQESVSSISSATSSVSRPRVRLGVTALSNNKPKGSQRPSSLNLSATTSALQKALKEKEEHIEQLLRERDLERSEVARAASQVDEVQDELSHLKVEKERFREKSDDNIIHLKAILQKLEKDKMILEEKLEDEKRKVEDLQFQIEEEVITKDDLESKTEEEEAKIKELQKQLRKEKEKADKYETDYLSLKKLTDHQERELKSMEETQTTYLDQVEELTHKLSQADVKIKAYDSSRLEEGAKTSQVGLDLAEKSAKVSELEDFLSMKTKEVKQLQSRVEELMDSLETSKEKQDKMHKTVEDLTQKLNDSEDTSNSVAAQLQEVSSANADIQRQLEGSQAQYEEMAEEKRQLESQIGEMMKNTGDSSKQLSILNEQLSQKNRKIEELQAALSTSTQSLGKTNDSLEQLRREKEKEKETLIVNNNNVTSTLNSQLEDVQRELEKTKSKIHGIETDFESEKSTLLKRKDREIQELKQQLETSGEELSSQEIQTQAHKQVLETITMEREAVQFEKEKLEKQLKRIETERDSMNSELIQAKVGVTKVQGDIEKAISDKKNVEERLQDLAEDKDKIETTQNEFKKQLEDTVKDKENISEARDQLQRDMMESKASLQHKDIQLEESLKEVEKLKTEITTQKNTLSHLSEQSSESGVLQTQLAEKTGLVESLKHQLSERAAATETLQSQLISSEEEVKTTKIELFENQEVIALLEENVEEMSSQVSALNTQVTTLQQQAKTIQQVRDQNKALTEQTSAAEKQYRDTLEGLEKERASLKEKINQATDQLSQRDKDIQSKSSKIASLENEKGLLSGYKSANQKLEKEVQDLRDQLNKLQSHVPEQNDNVIKNIDTSGNQMIAHLKEENESSQHQVAFLNSVIIELQKKNEDTQARLDAMEAGVLNGAGDESMDLTTPTKRAAPRVFCDICDVFDLHETEDCPMQEMSDSPPPTQYHGDRNELRPYCDICEEFHPPCSGISAVLRKREEDEDDEADQGAAAVAKVENWVRSVEGLTTVSDLDLSDPAKVFGDDMEFFHVHEGERAGSIRDSGYYDGNMDKSPTSPVLPFLGIKDHLPYLKQQSGLFEEPKQSLLKDETLVPKHHESTDVYRNYPKGIDVNSDRFSEDFPKDVSSVLSALDSVKWIPGTPQKSPEGRSEITCKGIESADSNTIQNSAPIVVKPAVTTGDTDKENDTCVSTTDTNTIGTERDAGVVGATADDAPSEEDPLSDSLPSPVEQPTPTSSSDYQSGQELLDSFDGGTPVDVPSTQGQEDAEPTGDTGAVEENNTAENCSVC